MYNQKETLSPFAVIPCPLSLQALTTTISVSIPMYLPILDILYKLNPFYDYFMEHCCFLSHKWVLDSVKYFFCMYADNHKAFALYSIDVTLYINLFSWY